MAVGIEKCRLLQDRLLYLAVSHLKADALRLGVQDAIGDQVVHHLPR
jgi:hypothetical protein